MRIAITFILIPIALAAVELPRTLAGVAPGESVDAYIGVLGYPSTQVVVGMEQIWNWGEGLLVKINKERVVTEVTITRAGRQKELGFDIGDPLAGATGKLGKSSSSNGQTSASVHIYKDADSGLVLTLSVDEAGNIAKINLAQANQFK
jgi:hypothetical protein